MSNSIVRIRRDELFSILEIIEVLLLDGIEFGRRLAAEAIH